MFVFLGLNNEGIRYIWRLEAKKWTQMALYTINNLDDIINYA